jgi:hypothetical protein
MMVNSTFPVSNCISGDAGCDASSYVTDWIKFRVMQKSRHWPVSDWARTLSLEYETG